MQSDAGTILLSIARTTISEAFGFAMAAEESASWLRDTGASFVTLKLSAKLRGCIGSLVAHRPLLEDVKANAYAAAFNDPRFSPLLPQELRAVRVEVSLLSEPVPMVFDGEHDVLSQLKPHIDGVIFEYREQRSTFLPQVWENLPQPKDFMAQLKYKAGLPLDFWGDGIKLSRYRVTKWQEN